MLVCRTVNAEIGAVYYEENTFHLTEHTLREAPLHRFRQLAGASAGKLRSVTITRAFKFRMFVGRLKFDTKIVKGKIEVDGFSSECCNGPVWYSEARRTMCYCMILSLAKTWRGSLISFIEEYLEIDGMWKGKQAKAISCSRCKRSNVVQAGS